MSRTAQTTYPNLLAFLEATGTTQVELAQLLRRSQGYISRLVNGIQQPSLDEALRIAKITGIPVESLAVRPRHMPVKKA
jgi:transcriptional regulator with XRE-family HTH domain